MPYDRWHLSRPPKAALECPHTTPEECEQRHPEAPLCKQHKGMFRARDHGVGKRWQARWRDPEGVQETELFAKKGDAEKYEDKMRAGVADGTYISPKGGETLVSALVDMWMAGQSFENPRTSTQYESRVRVHIKELPIGRLKLKDVTASVLLAWLSDRRQVLDETTVGLVFTHLMSMFDLAVDDDLLRKNPCRSRTVQNKKPKRSKPTPKDLAIDWDQSEKIRIELPDRYKATVNCGRGLGMRQGEIFGFSPDDICWDHPDGPMVHIQRQVTMDGSALVFDGAKGDNEDNPKDRWVELGEDDARALRDHMARFPPVEVTLPHATKDGEPMTVRLIFYSREKKALNRNYFNSYVWKPALAAVGVIADLDPELKRQGKRRWEKSRDKMMHALRHLYASMMIEGGVDVYTLADRLGHADPAFTLRKYVHRVAKATTKVRGALRGMYAKAA
ncbi:tyrosine-type recombinase/integrase [Streptomyces sp. NPDC053474]|uniref:tyrosine-type recombinase/integrase n=1 Tax=Streptomyces sp. NPDC053474 TaxID=3365704 RepID=UPI0037D849BB